MRKPGERERQQNRKYSRKTLGGGVGWGGGGGGTLSLSLALSKSFLTFSWLLFLALAYRAGFNGSSKYTTGRP